MIIPVVWLWTAVRKSLKHSVISSTSERNCYFSLFRLSFTFLDFNYNFFFLHFGSAFDRREEVRSVSQAGIFAF